jgi:hypothetical protein
MRVNHALLRLGTCCHDLPPSNTRWRGYHHSHLRIGRCGDHRHHRWPESDSEEEDDPGDTDAAVVKGSPTAPRVAMMSRGPAEILCTNTKPNITNYGQEHSDRVNNNYLELYPQNLH